MILLIDEEYGYKYWLAELTQEEYQKLLQRWATLRGLNCLIPVPFVIPQAKEVVDITQIPENVLFCHMHEWNDSNLEGSDYKIPKDDENFCMDGIAYSQEEVSRIFQQYNKIENNGTHK